MTEIAIAIVKQKRQTKLAAFPIFFLGVLVRALCFVRKNE